MQEIFYQLLGFVIANGDFVNHTGFPEGAQLSPCKTISYRLSKLHQGFQTDQRGSCLGNGVYIGARFLPCGFLQVPALLTVGCYVIL